MKNINSQFPLLIELIAMKLLKVTVGDNVYVGQFSGLTEHIDASFTMKNCFDLTNNRAYPHVTVFSMAFGDAASGNYKTNTICLSGNTVCISTFPQRSDVIRTMSIEILADVHS